jgi:hypothetical protein
MPYVGNAATRHSLNIATLRGINPVRFNGSLLKAANPNRLLHLLLWGRKFFSNGPLGIFTSFLLLSHILAATQFRQNQVRRRRAIRRLHHGHKLLVRGVLKRVLNTKKIHGLPLSIKPTEEGQDPQYQDHQTEPSDLDCRSG